MRKSIGDKMKGFVFDTFIVPAIENMEPMELLDAMPNGDNTPQAIYFTMSSHTKRSGEHWNLEIRDWFGDRSTIEICSIQTTQYTSLPQAIKWLFRDMMTFLMARYPNDEYTCRMLDFIIEKNPELKEKQFYLNCTKEVADTKQ